MNSTHVHDLNVGQLPVQVYGLDPQTDCMGHLSHAEFSLESEHPEHPKAYTPQEINATLFKYASYLIHRCMGKC